MTHVRSAAQVTPLESPHGEVVYELMGNAAGGAAAHSLAQIVIPPGKASRRHYHPVAEESYYILSGQGALDLDAERVTLRPGDAVVIPPGAVHQIHATGSADLVLLAVCVPAWAPDNSVYLEDGY